MIDIKYADGSVIVCIKPPGVLSTDEPGGLPELLRAQAGGEIRTVHRLDRVVSGLMVLARSARAASALSAQIMERGFGKEYLAVVHGLPSPLSGSMTDLLYRDKRQCMTFVAKAPGKGVQEAALDYETLSSRGGLTLVSIRLRTGRTHQIRAQFSSRGLPLVGDKKYLPDGSGCDIALWSRAVSFTHPDTGEAMAFSAQPPEKYPWTEFEPFFGVKNP